MIRRTRDSMRRWLSVLGVQLHAGQQRVLDAYGDGKRFLVVVCGRRWGKTLVAFVIASYGLLERDAKILVVSKTYNLASRVWAMLVPAVVRAFGNDVTVYRGSYTIRTVWGSELVLGSAEHPDSLLGSGWSLVVFDEAATCNATIWHQYLRPALMDRRGDAVFITTPRGHNYIWDLFQLAESDSDDWWSHQAPSSDNPYLAPEELAAARKTTDPVIWQQEYLAQFVTYCGMVYKTFDYERHVIDRLPDDFGEYTINVAVDPGLANRCAILWIAHNPRTGDDIVFDEHIESGMLYPDVLRVINAKRPPRGYDLLVCDVAGRQRGGETGRTFVSFMRGNGVYFRARRSDIIPGVNLVRSRLLNVDGETHLRFYRPGVPKTISAVENYHYAESDGPVSEEPVKDGITDHPNDALRYYVWFRHGRMPGKSWVA